jgi:hypothetical protein
MRPLTFLAICTLALPAVGAARAELEPRAVAVEPGVTLPGQPILLRWYFTGSKVVVSGGRFGTGAVVTGKSELTDRPLKSTKYTFDVWYKPAPDPAKPELKPAQMHIQYTAVAAVDRLTSYHGTEGWDVRYLKGWRTDSFAPEPGSKVYYFQPEEDAVERLAVAVLPVKEGETAADIMQKVRDDVPSHYSKVEFVSQYELTRQREPAQITTFRGIDQAHPDVKTTSIILVYTHRGRAYVVSARTNANRFVDRQPLLDGLVRSLTFSSASAQR